MWIERLMAGISHQHVLSYNPVLIQFLRKVSASKICSRSAGVQSEIISRSFSSTAREDWENTGFVNM